MNVRYFSGTVKWPVSFGGHIQWEYNISFSEDWNHITGGEIVATQSDYSKMTIRKFKNESNNWCRLMKVTQKAQSVNKAP